MTQGERVRIVSLTYPREFRKKTRCWENRYLQNRKR